MADNNSLINSKNTLVGSQPGYSVTRAKSFKIASQQQNYSQYVNTIKAYALAGLPFEHIANAGDLLGDLVERGEIDVPLTALEEKMGEVAEDESKLLAWQNRGETISLIRQLPSANPTNKEVVTISQDLTTQPQNQQTLGIVEGIGVFKGNPSPIQSPANNSFQLESNPYLRAPADLKKI